MFWQFWQQAKPKAPSEQIQKLLMTQYKLDAQVLSKMRSLEKPGKFAGRPVRYVRVFDPSRVADGKQGVRRYDDLSNHLEAVLLEGHIEKDGSIFLADRRSQRWAQQQR